MLALNCLLKNSREGNRASHSRIIEIADEFIKGKQVNDSKCSSLEVLELSRIVPDYGEFISKEQARELKDKHNADLKALLDFVVPFTAEESYFYNENLPLKQIEPHSATSRYSCRYSSFLCLIIFIILISHCILLSPYRISR